MPFYEYKVVPAPDRAPKVKGLKGAAKFASALEALMNELAKDGWEYQRAESLPDEEKKGFMAGKEVVTRNILVFRRELYFEDTAEDTPAEARAAAPLTLSRKVEPQVAPETAEPSGPFAEADAAADMDDIYAGAEATTEEPAPTRRPLVADRKGQGVDF
jgi:hypothetical protein